MSGRNHSYVLPCSLRTGVTTTPTKTGQHKGERDRSFRSGHKKEPQAERALGVHWLLPQIRLIDRATGYRGMGSRPARPNM